MSRGHGTFVFVLAGSADADNIIPVIWAVSADGTPCHVVVVDAGVYDSLRESWWISQRSSVMLSKLEIGRASCRERV